MLHTEEVRLRIRHCSVAVYPPGATFGPRRLRDWELVWILQGDTQWECDGKAWDAPPGTMILARPGMNDFFRWDPVRQTRHAFFHFDLELGRAALPPVDRWPVVQRLPEGDVLRPLFRHLAWLQQARPPGWEELERGTARQLFLAFVLRAFETAEDATAELPAPVEEALRFVQGRWAKGTLHSPPLAALARAAGVSPGHLCRLFRRTVGCGPLQALRIMRVERGAMLLARSNLRVGEVADRVGFESAFHFSRCFAEVYGVSPRAYRKQHALKPVWPSSRLVVIQALAGRLWQLAPAEGGDAKVERAAPR